MAALRPRRRLISKYTLVLIDQGGGKRRGISAGALLLTTGGPNIGPMLPANATRAAPKGFMRVVETTLSIGVSHKERARMCPREALRSIQLARVIARPSCGARQIDAATGWGRGSQAAETSTSFRWHAPPPEKSGFALPSPSFLARYLF
jgi:hypothetical protein